MASDGCRETWPAPGLAAFRGDQSALGLEKGNPTMPVVANLKHHIANEQELDRAESSSNVDERTRRQIYDLSYEIAIRESDPGSIMCSYNQVNGVYACENPIMQAVLRNEIGFEGFIGMKPGGRSGDDGARVPEVA